MNTFPIGDTITYSIECRKRVNGTETLFDPTTLKVSFVLPSGAEDTLTFGGTDARDDQLTRVSTGIYEANYVLSVPGDWYVNVQAVDVVGDKSWPSKQMQRTRIIVRQPDGHTFSDVQAPTS